MISPNLGRSKSSLDLTAPEFSGTVNFGRSSNLRWSILGVALKPYLGEIEIDASKFGVVYFFVLYWSIRDE